MHESSFFVTLTYAPWCYPIGFEDRGHWYVSGSVCPYDLVAFVKRLRGYESVRYFGVGEYGERTGRAHYHLILFGLRDYRLVGRCWPFGQVHVGLVTSESCAYVCGYTVKKWTKVGVEGLDGRHPEFTRMSLKPGIGAFAGDEVGRAYSTRSGSVALVRDLDVASGVRIDGRLFPLGRYLRDRARVACGQEVGMPEVLKREIALGGRVLRRPSRGVDSDLEASIIRQKGVL